jgi:hypothetical protein
MKARNPDSRCKGTNEHGKPCGAAPTAGGLCFFHANPNKASELGRIGGRSKRRVRGEDIDPLPDLHSAIAIRDALGKVISDAHAGKISSKVAAGLSALMNLQLRAIEMATFEERLKVAEERLEAIKQKLPPLITRHGSVRPFDAQTDP